ncbi:23S rRNA (pseudouridine(1915)-N(3))-methyltransferase RlmH [soil metagenome]
MLRIKIIAVGKKHNALFSNAISHFEARVSRHAYLSWDIIPPSNAKTESKQIINKCANSTVVLLDEVGAAYGSGDVARLLQRAQNQSAKELCFVIGGAYGVDASVKVRADVVVSLSALVFPHQLVRLILVEQLYRGFDILAGGKYHHS